MSMHEATICQWNATVHLAQSTISAEKVVCLPPVVSAWIIMTLIHNGGVKIGSVKLDLVI